MKQVTIYTKNQCPYCDRAKALLDKKGAQYEELNVEQDQALRAQMEKVTGGKKTLPQIFIQDMYVGGCDDLHELERQGKLSSLLENN